jgi:geranylgeranyl pyrophosphate synthase
MAFDMPQLKLPAPPPKQQWRPTQETIPPTLERRQRVRSLIERYVAEHKPVPPMPLAEMRAHTEKALAGAGPDAAFVEYGAVLLNNVMWHEQLAGVPFHRRLLLMPKCLRAEATCPAPFDEFGLLCKQCGQCSIQDLQVEAERLGYAVLVAEGSAIVMAIIETGKIDAIVGVSCLSVLEKAFPYMESAAIPGIAIPLLQDDCKDTNVDLDWIWDVIHLTRDDKTYRLDLDQLRDQVDAWFRPDELDRLLGPVSSRTEQIARQWLGRGGKRWRPFLAVCALRAVRQDFDSPLSDDVKRLAIAVECFHKASLVHDDIEDGDTVRYDEPTVHAEHGLAVGVNVGDYLLGEGYRLIAAAEFSPEQRAVMLRIAAEGHRDLSLGQGAELCWQNEPQPLRSTQVLDIFRRKTAPAFEVALRLGAVAGGADEATHQVLGEYSTALGIAYQIRDDLEDWFAPAPGGDADANHANQADWQAMRPTLIPALALESAHGQDKELIRDYWHRRLPAQSLQRMRNVLASAGVEARTRDLLAAYKEEAVRSLRALENPTLKGLLRRVMTKIFNDLEIKGWCREHEAAHAAGGAPRAESVA